MATGLRLSAADSASTPDAAPLDITGDIDVRMALSLDDWTPAATQALLTKGALGSGQISYIWSFGMIGADPKLFFAMSPDGSDGAAFSMIDNGPVVADGGLIAIRQFIDVDNGAGLRISTTQEKSTTCATALADIASDAGWTTLSSSGLGGTGGPFSGTAPLVIGAGLVGCVMAVVVKNGIAGTTVANPDFTTNPTSPFTDAAGRTWTLSAGASIRGGCCGEADFWGWADDFNSNSQGWTIIS